MATTRYQNPVPTTPQASTNDPAALAGAQLDVPQGGAAVAILENSGNNSVVIYPQLFFYSADDTQTESASNGTLKFTIAAGTLATFDTRNWPGSALIARVTFKIESGTDDQHGAIRIASSAEIPASSNTGTATYGAAKPA